MIPIFNTHNWSFLNSRFLAILLLSIAQVTFAQYSQQLPLEKYIITEGTDNGKDITSTLISVGAFTVFYRSDKSRKRYMANVWPNTSSQSFGIVKSVKKIKSSNPKEEIKHFKWKYYNTYDEKKGKATVEVTKVSDLDLVLFSMKIVLKNSEVIILNGYYDTDNR